MELSKKQRILEILETLVEAIKYIENNINSDYKFMSELSLQAITSIINVLENSKRVDSKLYKLSKKVYNNVINIDQQCNAHVGEICNKTIIALEQIIQILNEQNNKKIDIVFMPYNASMWNSMESVWKAAYNDEKCNCYVVPIPYYKLVSEGNGSVTQIFTYEGDMMPKYVPIIDYRKFNLKKLKPDIIYVHNQYDEYNNATRIKSDYFSYNLKKYTDMLVYITYGILGTYPVSFYKKYYSFIATRDFDKIIVQSPIFGLIAEKGGVEKERLMALGSPKFDALIDSLKNKKSNELFTSKFKGKTVFLWTTNLMKIINGKDQVINEIEEVFKLIENNEYYGLIYRPHPLEFEYVKSKAPECFERYKNLLNSVNDSNNIVVDTSPSYYESFEISDALITDRSSVLIEYMATGKPVLIYDIDLKRKYYNEKVFDIFSNYIVGEEDMTVQKFINMVENKEDKNKQKRLNALQSVLANLDGTSGEKIHSSIKSIVEGEYF